jgi:tetratricopeptide (TPR) repeat protein
MPMFDCLINSIVALTDILYAVIRHPSINMVIFVMGWSFSKMRHPLIAWFLLSAFFCFPISSIADESVEKEPGVTELSEKESAANGPGAKEYKLASDLWLKREYASAEPHLAAAIRTNPRNTGYRWMHGTILLHLGRCKEAAEELKMSYSPRDSSAHRSMVMGEVATCYAQSQDWPQAVKAYEDLSRMPFSRYDPQVMNDLARVYGMAGMNEKSIAERKWAIRYGYADRDQSVLQCHSLLHRGDLARAIAVGEYAESKGDYNPMLMQLIAKAYLRQGQNEGGLKEIELCCKTADLCAENWGIKGEIESQVGLYNEAITDLNTAIKLPINAAAFFEITPEKQILEWERVRTQCYVKLKKYPKLLSV